MSLPIKSKWFVTPKANPDAKLRLHCFPYSAGNASTYTSWVEHLSEDIELVAIQPPGRARRMGEAAYTSMADLIAGLCAEIEPWLDKPYVIFGHSLGSRVGFELIHQALQRQWRMPEHFIASGSNAPHICRKHKRIYQLEQAEFIAGLKQFSPTTATEIFDNENLLKLFMPMMRADFTIADTYFREVGEPLDIPVSVFCGSTDTDAPEHEMSTWQAHFTQPLNCDVFEGGHFFIEDNSEAVVARVNAILRDLHVRSTV